MSKRRKKNQPSSGGATAWRKGISFQFDDKASSGLSFGSHHHWTVIGVCVFLAGITLTVFGQTLRHGFSDYDDNVYVYENDTVIHGLTLKGIISAFSYGGSDNWVPLTTISHMLDCQFYGLNAGGHHLTNVLLHTASVILLFLLLRDMTGAMWRSAFVAAVFAVHPLHVESVAWVAERKDMLSGFFFMLTLWAYVRYVRNPGSLIRYLAVAFFFALGLMSKPMLVTLPFVLLLLDYWPLGRFTSAGPGDFSIPRRLIFEKIPLLMLAVASCVVTVLMQKEIIRAGALSVSRSDRISNPIVSYAVYLGQFVYPVRLAVFYPFPTGGFPFWKVTLAFLVLVAISTAAFRWRQKHPCFLVGWLWYVGMLVPVIGVVQVGLQAHGDRYTYLPQIGLCLMMTWTLVELSAGWRSRRLVLGGLAIVSIVGMVSSAWLQTSYWKTSESLWTHTINCTSNNGEARYFLGNALFEKGRVDEAIIQFQKALAINPDLAEAHYNLGNILILKRQADEAIIQFQKALEINPSFAGAHYNLGDVLFQKGRVDEAIVQFQKALEINPDLAEARYNLGAVLLKKGRVDEAISQFQKTLAIQPGLVEAQLALSHSAWILATWPDPSVRNGTKAVELAQQADRLSGGNNPTMIATLAAAYAEAGRFPEAVASAQRALQLAAGQNNAAPVAALEAQLKLYQAGSPFRDAGASR
jgi:protein O-mannosyl-transferase